MRNFQDLRQASLSTKYSSPNLDFDSLSSDYPWGIIIVIFRDSKIFKYAPYRKYRREHANTSLLLYAGSRMRSHSNSAMAYGVFARDGRQMNGVVYVICENANPENKTSMN